MTQERQRGMQRYHDGKGIGSHPKRCKQRSTIHDVINKSSYNFFPKKIGSHASYECLRKCRRT